MPLPSLRFAALAVAAAFSAASCLSLPCHAADAPLIPAADFFSNPAFGGLKLSPSGRYLAVKLTAPNGREQLTVTNIATRESTTVAYYSKADIGRFAWVNDDRLIYDTADKKLGLGDQRFGPGLFAVDRNGEKNRQLASRTGSVIQKNQSREMLPWHTFMLTQEGAQDKDEVYAIDAEFNAPGDWAYSKLIRLNTKTGRRATIERPGDVMNWLLDAQGEPRIATTLEAGKETVHYLDPQTKAWRKLATFDAFTTDKNAYVPLAFGPDGVLYIAARAGRDHAALHTLDLTTGAISPKPLVALDGYDFHGKLIMGNGKLLGIRYLTDGEGTTWFDAAMKTAQEEIDAQLSDTVNVVTPPARPETPYLLVEAYSDTQPHAYFIYDTANKTLTAIGKAYPNIQPEQMGTMQFIRYAARDGLPVPAWLTLPKSEKKNLPLVVMVHPGPFRRGGEWGWEPSAQFLASRGYAVLSPEYRGSTGYGEKHFQAGWKQWGLGMQDDIADGVKWAITQGIADPSRICIAGTSYGGYAALMGLAKNPELFKCGIEWAGITDLGLMYSGHWSFRSDLPPMWKKYGMPVLVGDPVKDAEQLKNTSPVHQAARITQPLLMAHGTLDMSVPLYHGTKFRDVVKVHNKQVEWVEYDEEGHGWFLPSNRIDFWTRVEKFLDKNIGAGVKQAATQASTQAPLQTPTDAPTKSSSAP